MKLYDRQNCTDWFKDSKYGLFIHYLYMPEDMKKFNAEEFAKQVNEMGAGYVIFTLGQNSGYYCGPNPTYEALAGYPKGSKCSELDIPMQAANALKAYDIKLMLYLPSHTPSGDNAASIKIGVDQTVEPMWEMNDTVVKNWCSIVKDWSVHYGKNIKGWWFDGFYDLIKLNEHHAKFYKEAVLAGNDESILALNAGLTGNISPANIYCDYTAGEFNEYGELPTQRFVNGSQWHIASFIGKDWLEGSANVDKVWMADYINKVNAKDGVVSVGVHIEPDGTFSDEQLDFMRYIKANVKG